MPVSVEAAFSAFWTNHKFPLYKNLIIGNLRFCLRLTGMENLLIYYQCPKLNKVSLQLLCILSIPFKLTKNQHRQSFMPKFWFGFFFLKNEWHLGKKKTKQTSSCTCSASLIAVQLNVVEGIKNFQKKYAGTVQSH